MHRSVETPEPKKSRERPVTVIGPRPGIGEWAADLWNYRGVLRALCARDLGGKYKQAALGIAWAVLQPVVLTGVFTFVLHGVAGLETSIPYSLFVLASLLVFQLLQQIIALGSPSFVSARGIVTRVYFPRIYTVIAGSTSAYVNAGVTLLLLVGAMAWHGVGPGGAGGVALALVCLVATALLALGAAALLAAVNARFRDIQHALPFMLTALLYVSPVLYPLSECPDWAERLLPWNPVTGLVGGFRQGLLGLDGPPAVVIGGACAASLVVFAVGLWTFERTQADLVDVL